MQRAHCVRGAPLPMMRYISKVYKVYSLVRTKFLSSRPYCPSAYAREFCGPLLYYEKGPIIKFNFGNESCQNISKVGRVSVLNIFDKKFQKCSSWPFSPGILYLQWNALLRRLKSVSTFPNQKICLMTLIAASFY